MAYTGDFIRRLGETEFLMLGKDYYVNIRYIQHIQLPSNDLIVIKLEGGDRIWIEPKPVGESDFSRLMGFLRRQGFFLEEKTPEEEEEYFSVRISEGYFSPDEDDF